MKLIQVAVGIVINRDKQILVALRSSTQEHGDLWEFPGGKVEPGENFYQALCRELKEEIGVEVQKAQALINLIHQYPHYKVELDVWIIQKFHGIAHGAERQALKWVGLEELKKLKLPGANWKIVETLATSSLLKPSLAEE